MLEGWGSRVSIIWERAGGATRVLEKDFLESQQTKFGHVAWKQASGRADGQRRN
jgi:hypothetical protein